MNDERARQAVDHLQSAALQLIAAVRAALDVAEDLVRDPGRPRPHHDGGDGDITHIDVEP